MPMPPGIGEPTPRCPHGYWEHSQFSRCPQCHGRDAHNKDAVPVHGPGNGWLLKKGAPVCLGCGGPGCAGYGLLPSGAEAWTEEEHAAYRAKQILCYSCTLNGLQYPIVELNRISPAPGLPGVREVQSADETYWQCEKCWRWGRPRCAHECNGHNWHKTVKELHEVTGEPQRRKKGDYGNLLAAGAPPADSPAEPPRGDTWPVLHPFDPGRESF